MTYDPRDWFWTIGSDISQAYSSAAFGMVTTWDAERVTPIASMDELNEVLRAAGVDKSSVIDVERDRRIDGGFTFGGKKYDSAPKDRENIAGAASAAGIAMLSGAAAGNLRWHGGTTDFAWIAQDNTLTPMDAQTVFAFGNTAMIWKQRHIFAARAIKDATVLPANFRDNSFWP